MDFLAELWRFMRVRKKFWLLPILRDDGGVRRACGADQGLGGRAVHLHAVLGACAFSASPRSITTARRRWSRTAGSLRPRRRNASPARSTIPRFRKTRSRIASTRPQTQARRARSCRLLRQAVPEIRAAARDLRGDGAARFPLLQDGDPALAARKAVPEDRCCGTS